MLEKLLHHLCQITDEKIDAVIDVLKLTPEDLTKTPSAHMRVVLSDTFNIPVTQIDAMLSVISAGADAHEYSVCFLFDENLTHVLLQKKIKTDFAGLYNGVGGVQHLTEDKFQGALRKIKEETGISETDIIDFTHIGTLILPYDCKTKTATTCILHYFSGVVWKDKPAPQPGRMELLEWHNVNYVQNTPVSMAEKQFAGNGDLQYFVHMALKYHMAQDSVSKIHTLKKPEN